MVWNKHFPINISPIGEVEMGNFSTISPHFPQQENTFHFHYPLKAQNVTASNPVLAHPLRIDLQNKFNIHKQFKTSRL